MNSQSLANMSSTDGNADVTEGLGRDQNLNNIEKQESPRRGSVATPVKSSIFSNAKATPTTKDLFASIEIDDSYDPVTPSNSSAKAACGNGRNRVRSLSPRKAASTKRTPNQISKTKITESSKQREIKENFENLRSTLRGEYSEEYVDDWEAENDGVKSPENTWGKAGKVIGSAGKPTHPNGRVEGRKLVPWHKVRMMEKLILSIVYECRSAELSLPWDKIAHRVCPGSSGAAAIQHVNKLREILIPEGHLVPPPFGKKNTVDPNVRGYIRDMDSEDPKATRPVTWDEEIDDLKESLVIPGVTRGSGTYRRDRARWQNNKATIVEETPTKTFSTRSRPDKRASKAKTEQKEKSFMVKKERSESIDPAEMPSDEDYDPGNRLKIKGNRKRKVKVKTERKYNLDETSDSEVESFGYSDDDDFLEETPCKKVAGNHAMTPLASLPLKLKISPHKLKKFAAGASMNLAEEEVAVDEYHGDGDDDAETIVDAHARDFDDVFGHGGLHLNNGNAGLQNQLVFTPYGYNGGMNPGSGTYNPQGALNAQAYSQLYGHSYNNHNFMNAETGPYGSINGSYQYPNGQYNSNQFFGFQSSSSAPIMNHGLNFDGPVETMQDLNGGHNSMSSLPPSIGVSSNDTSGFGNFTDSAGTTYDGAIFEFIDPTDIPGQGFEPFNDGFVQDYNSNQPFNPDDNNL
ncbi:hypothetical protein BCON_0019g00750 [Botryotinia convoluta]|uniref:Uncharacterized protein n=1 Tax=Botryotinia convoluta TaxID=54673 RepID=A0A4Z1ILK1_9HELO|nr:hypothetical protein BCON_0019g00750 [Botryotinia convoluta]